MADNLRPFIPEDWEAVNRIYKQGIDTNLATFQTSCPAYEAWDSAHLSCCRLVYVLEGRVVGWAALSPVSSCCVYRGVAELSIYIDETVRGSGIGTQLLNRIITDSQTHGIWTLQSGIIQDNKASILLHRKCGFREVGCREKIARNAHGEWKNTVLMERRSTLNFEG